MVMCINDLFGRQINQLEVPAALLNHPDCNGFSAFRREGRHLICVRCGGRIHQRETRLATGNFLLC